MSESKSVYTTGSLLGEGDDTPVIDTFRGEWEFLSNFYPVPIEIEGITYPTTEHAFQAMKTHEESERYTMRDAASPAVAKRKGKKVTLRENWDTERFAVMEQVLRAKFADPVLRDKLLATGNRPLIEGNSWRDTTWGMVRDKDGTGWRGRNELGKLLMKIREELQAMSQTTETDTDAELIRLALTARETAYAPYSKYHVGAAIQMASGKVFTGCNVENASYGLCNCAERTAIFTAVHSGERILQTVVVATDDGGSPCGACRQVIWEFAPRDGSPVRVVLVDKDGTIVRDTSIAELLPYGFRLEN